MKIWKNLNLDFEQCAHCSKSFKLSRIKGEVVLCNCRSSSPTSIDLNRFLSGFSERRAIEIYSEYVANKTKKWTPENCDTGSLKSCIARYGDEIGLLKFNEICKKKNATGLNYFLRKTNGDEISARKLQTERQSVGRVEKYVLKYGFDAGVEKWASRNKHWSEKMHIKKEKDNSSIPLELVKEHERKLQYVYVTGILTDISKRMFTNIPESEESKQSDIRHVDHQFSRSAAFHFKISPKIISAPINLKWLSKAENLAKKDICAFSHDELIKRYINWNVNDATEFYDKLCETLLSNWRSQGMHI